MGSNTQNEIDLSENSLTIWKNDYSQFDSNEIWKSSDNVYVFSQGTYYTSVNDDGTEVILLFSDNTILYRKKINFDDVSDALVFDDGSVVFYTDENQLISLDANGKQIFKKDIGIDFEKETCKLTKEYAYFYGYQDDDIKLSYFSYANKKLWSKAIPDIPYTYLEDGEDGEEEEDFYYADSAEFLRLPRGFLLLYEDKKTTRMYDFEGTEIVPTEEEFTTILEHVNQKGYLQKMEKARKTIIRLVYLAKKDKERKPKEHPVTSTKKEAESQKAKGGFFSKLFRKK